VSHRKLTALPGNEVGGWTGAPANVAALRETGRHPQYPIESVDDALQLLLLFEDRKDVRGRWPRPTPDGVGAPQQQDAHGKDQSGRRRRSHRGDRHGNLQARRDQAGLSADVAQTVRGRAEKDQGRGCARLGGADRFLQARLCPRAQRFAAGRVIDLPACAS